MVQIKLLKQKSRMTKHIARIQHYEDKGTHLMTRQIRFGFFFLKLEPILRVMKMIDMLSGLDFLASQIKLSPTDRLI